MCEMMNRINLEEIKKEAESYYTNGEYYCSEAIVATIRNQFQVDMPIETIAIASGFPIGVGGAKCICGAVSGGIICIGYFFGRTNPKDPKVNKAIKLAKELHDFFATKNKTLCCRILTKDVTLGSESHMKQCIGYTGDIAVKTAEIIARELCLECDV
jgi:C_GCAxxG_C_C family probable redox protein